MIFERLETQKKMLKKTQRVMEIKKMEFIMKVMRLNKQLIYKNLHHFNEYRKALHNTIERYEKKVNAKRRPIRKKKKEATKRHGVTGIDKELHQTEYAAVKDGNQEMEETKNDVAEDMNTEVDSRTSLKPKKTDTSGKRRTMI